MADKHDVRRGADVDFADGVTRHIKPLTIRQLRKFVVVIEKMTTTEDAAAMSEQDIDLMRDASKIILEKVDPGLASDDDRLEDTVDIVVFNQLMNVAMGASSPEE